MRYHAGPTLKDEIVTVGGTDDDFSTIQKAIDWFKRFRITGDCRIDVDAGTYDEGMVFEDLLINAGATLTLRGDPRVLAAISYVDGADCNQAGLANGGDGVVTLSNAGNNLTVAMATTNPDFDADGWGSGDTILVYDNAGATTEETIDSVANNVITLTAAAPAVGNDGTAICLVPNRRIVRPTAGYCIEINAVRGIVVDGFYIESSTGSNCDGILVNNAGYCTVHNVVTFVEDSGIIAVNRSVIHCSSGAISVWGTTQGIYALTSYINSRYAVVNNCTTGFFAFRFGCVDTASSIGVNCTSAYYTSSFSFLLCSSATARQNTTGYYAGQMGYAYAISTNANNNGNGTDYSPAVSDTFGNNNGSITWS